MGLNKHQLGVLETSERVSSVFSLCGCFFIITSFIISPALRKPINRLIFYASWGNAMYNVATLISQAGIRAGQASTLCQVQAFLIQMFLPADALWNLAMAINVYLTVFRKYNALQLRALEWKYHIMCYGGSFIPALVMCFVETKKHGKIYGPATTWCWVSPGWNWVRLALLYGPCWGIILATFSMYMIAGREIFIKRKQLRSFSQPQRPSNPTPIMVENPFTSFKTTEIHISSELAGLPTAHTSEVSLPMGSKDRVASPNRGYDQYSVTIETSPMSPRLHQATPMTLPPTPGAQSMYHRHNNAALEANAAAWGYTRTASLFYVSLLITWLPSSINRVYGLAHPKEISFGFNYAAGLVLPLMGFWNAIIYITTSWSAVKALLTGKSPISLRGKHIGVRGRSMSLDTNAAGDGHMKKKRPTSTSVSDSTRGFADADSV